MRPRPNKELILESLAAIAGGAGRPPSRSEFISLSGISEHQISQFVCWRHNWPDCPPHLEVLELSSLLKSLPTSDS